MIVTTAREYLYSLGLTKSPTGRGRFSNDAKTALAKAIKEGKTFSDYSNSDGGVKKIVPSGPTEKVNVKDVREWANKNGHSVGDRGRISGKIKQAYLDATAPEDRKGPAKVIDTNDFRQAYWRYPDGTNFKGEDSNGKIHTVSGRNACACGYSLVGHLCDNATALVCVPGGMERIEVSPIV